MPTPESLQSYYDDHASQARQHEGQRERVTNIVLSIAGLLIGLVTFANLQLWSLIAAGSIILLGIYGFLFSGKHYERFKFHTAVLQAFRKEIERAHNDPEYGKVSLSSLRASATEKHYREFVWPKFSGTNDKAQAAATSWIARQRLHVFWEAVHLLIVGIGLALCIAILLKHVLEGPDKPTRIEIITPVVITQGAAGTPKPPASGSKP
jgi:hypothetical protein